MKQGFAAKRRFARVKKADRHDPKIKRRRTAVNRDGAEGDAGGAGFGGQQFRRIVRNAFGEKGDRTAFLQAFAAKLECLLILRHVLAGVDPAVKRQCLDRLQQKRDDRHSEQRRFGEKRDFSRQGDENQSRVDQAVRMIHNKDDAGPSRNDVGIDGFDPAKKNGRCDPEDAANEPSKRMRSAAIENQVGEGELFELDRI